MSVLYIQPLKPLNLETNGVYIFFLVFNQNIHVKCYSLENSVLSKHFKDISVIGYLRILHLLLIIWSLGCKVFVLVGPRMQ